jgi:uncharacterized OsmC-like protein
MTFAPAIEPSSPGELMNQRRAALIRTYRKQPERAMIQDGARTVQTRYAPTDPLHSEVEIGLGYGVTTPVGVHRGLGGLHDFPNPGDILCSALAACADSTIRQIAGQLNVEVRALEVSVAGDIDLRGTLCVSSEVPVRFQQMSVSVRLELGPNTPPRMKEKLLAASEHCCVVLRTLRQGVPVKIELDDAGDDQS